MEEIFVKQFASVTQRKEEEIWAWIIRLVVYAGIDASPYQSGQFNRTNRKISNRGSKLLRKIGYETMRVLKTHKEPEDAAVYRFILKKEAEGESKRQAK
jgi:transposase